MSCALRLRTNASPSCPTIQGEIEPNILLESVKASQTMFCGVSAMLSKAFPIAYRVVLNGTEIGVGEASFDWAVEQKVGPKSP